VPTGFDLVLVSFALHTNTHPFAQSRQLFGAPKIFEFSSCPTYCKRSSHRQLVNSALPYKISFPSLWVMVMLFERSFRYEDVRNIAKAGLHKAWQACDHGTKRRAVLMNLYLALNQPDENLDNQSTYEILRIYSPKAKETTGRDNHTQCEPLDQHKVPRTKVRSFKFRLPLIKS
jgi:hypothetical protein